MSSNPFAVPPEHELLADMAGAPEGFTENMFFQLWDPRGIGAWLHFGSHRDRPSLWRALVVVYLDDGQLLAGRSYGQATDDRGPSTGDISARCEVPLERWSVRLDTALERVDRETMGSSLVGSGVATPVALEVVLDATCPVHDLFAHAGAEEQSWARRHHEQAFEMRGSLTVDGATRPLEGSAFRDHSTGVRDLTTFGANVLVYASFPSGRVLQLISCQGADFSVNLENAWLWEEGSFRRLDVVELPTLANTVGHPEHVVLRLALDGEPMDVDVEVLSSAAFVASGANDWSAGVDLDLPDDPLYVVECPARFTLPGGEVGYGQLERNVRRSRLGMPWRS